MARILADGQSDFATSSSFYGPPEFWRTTTLGWHIEEILLHSPVVQQHRNKLNYQSLEIASTLMRSKAARTFHRLRRLSGLDTYSAAT